MSERIFKKKVTKNWPKKKENFNKKTLCGDRLSNFMINLYILLNLSRRINIVRNQFYCIFFDKNIFHHLADVI